MDQRLDIIARYRAGDPRKDIAAALGVTVRTVDNVRKSMGEPTRASHAGRAVEAYVTDVARDLDLGITPAEIAAGRGVLPRSIARRLARAGHGALAARFYEVGHRSGRCAECGGATHARSDQCSTCRRAAAAREAREARQAAQQSEDDLESPQTLEGWVRVKDRGVIRWVKAKEVA